MHAPITLATGYNEISAHPYGILKGVVDGNAFVERQSASGDRRRVSAPQPGDIIVEGKRGPRHFREHQPRLHSPKQGITTIVLGGFLHQLLR